jgi:outer membrane lipoprotein-sorting protein
MKKKKILLGFVSVMLLLQGIAWAEAKTAATKKTLVQLMREAGFKHKTATWTNVEVRKTGKEKPVTDESKVWVSGDEMRLEGKDANGKTHVMIMNDKDTFVYIPDENKAFHWDPAAEKRFSQNQGNARMEQLIKRRKEAQKIGSEIVDGKLCEILTYTFPSSEAADAYTSNVKEWFWRAGGLPLKNIVAIPEHKAHLGVMSMDVPASESENTIKDLTLDQPVDENLFKIPANVTIETLKLPEKMPGTGGTTEPKAQETPASKSNPAPEVKDLLKKVF